MSDLVSRLNDILHDDDHERGCEGRNYTCTCGFDERSWNTAKEAAAEITRLQKELETAREALERLVTTYDGMEDGNGDPCPDVAHAKTVIRALKDKEVAG